MSNSDSDSSDDDFITSKGQLKRDEQYKIRSRTLLPPDLESDEEEEIEDKGKGPPVPALKVNATATNDNSIVLRAHTIITNRYGAKITEEYPEQMAYKEDLWSAVREGNETHGWNLGYAAAKQQDKQQYFNQHVAPFLKKKGVYHDDTAFVRFVKSKASPMTESESRTYLMKLRLKDKKKKPSVEGDAPRVLIRNASSSFDSSAHPHVVIFRTGTGSLGSGMKTDAYRVLIVQAEDHALLYADTNKKSKEASGVVVDFYNALRDRGVVFRLYRSDTDDIVDIPDQSITTNLALRAKLRNMLSNRVDEWRLSAKQVATYSSGHYDAENLETLKKVYEKACREATLNADGCLLYGGGDGRYYPTIIYGDTVYHPHRVSAAVQNGGLPKSGEIIGNHRIPEVEDVDHPMFLKHGRRPDAAHTCGLKRCIQKGCVRFVPGAVNIIMHEWCHRHPDLPCRCKYITGFSCRVKKNVDDDVLAEMIEDALHIADDILSM